MVRKNGAGRARWGAAVAAAALAVALAFIAAMAWLTLPSSDDYWYRYFLDEGLRHYLSLVKQHYLTINGRVIVHVAVQIVLHLGSWSFALVSVIMFAAIPPALTAASGREMKLALWAGALFIPAVLSVPRSVLNQGILWTSAFFNYVFPTAMLTVEVTLFELCLRRKRIGIPLGALCVLWSAACGATTEQSGFAAILLAAYFLAKALWVRCGRIMASLAFFGSIAGLLSVFASPATRARMNSGASMGSIREILSTMYANMGPCAKELCSSWLTGAALAALFLLTGAAASGRLKRRWPLGVSCVPAIMSVAVGITPEGLRTALFVALCLAAGVAAAALMASGEEAVGALIMAGLASFAVILVTDSVGGRTLVPFLLTLLAGDAVLLSGYIRRARGALGAVPPASLLALGLAAAIPFTGGILKNRRVEQENIENTRAAHETGVLRYCVDYDERYTWLKLQTVFMEEYLAGEGLPADTQVIYYSHIRPNVRGNGQIQYPAYIREDGETLIWIRVVELFGGRIVYRQGYEVLTVELPWMECNIDIIGNNGDRAVFTWSDDGMTRSVTVDRLLTESRTLFPMEVYTGVLGFDVTFDEAENIYTFAAPEGY